MRRSLPLVVAFMCGALFAASVFQRTDAMRQQPDPGVAVVVPPALQVLLYGGDRYLAADLQAMRAVISAGGMRPDEAGFRARGHLVASQLNPCHEDNYWIGNSELTWGGGPDEAYTLTRRAMNCRLWDPWPAFFHGFNNFFFRRDIVAARAALEVGASRADEKTAAAFRNFAIGMLLQEAENASIALEMVRVEAARTEEPRLRRLLEQRVKRLEGLVALRRAHQEFRSRFGRELNRPQELIDHGLLSGPPEDPTGLGYVFENGEFNLARLQNKVLENLR